MGSQEGAGTHALIRRAEALRASETDLAFDPTEPRGPDGRWVKSPLSKIKHLLGSLAREDTPLPGMEDWKPKQAWHDNPSHVKLNDKDYSLDDAVKVVGDAYQWPDMDRVGGDGSDTFKSSAHQQHKAQIVAKAWDAEIDGNSPTEQQYAASLWEQYQSPSYYHRIQEVLRTGKSKPGDPGYAVVGSTTKHVFEEGGFTTEAPMTVYRALKSKDIDWTKKLTPGTTFTDKGIVSTTAHPRFAEGWLGINADSFDPSEGPRPRDVHENDVVVELRLPTGQRIVGGDPGFCETMLPPGTKFRIVSSTVKESRPVNPLGGEEEAPFRYTHIVAKVVPQ